MQKAAPKTTWVLASGSPRRRELLEGLGLSLRIVKPEIDESEKPGESPRRYVQRLAREKARKGWTLHSSGKAPGSRIIVIAADTTVVTEKGQILGKPRHRADAIRMLGALSGKIHQVFTGYSFIVIERDGSRRETSRVVKSAVKIRALTSAQIAKYVDTGEPMDKAGAYAAQGIGSLLVESIRGSYFNVVGLPICQLCRDLEITLGSESWAFLASNKITPR